MEKVSVVVRFDGTWTTSADGHYAYDGGPHIGMRVVNSIFMLHISFSLHITSILQHTCVPVVDSADNFGDNTRESLRRRFEKLLVKQTAKDENSLEKKVAEGGSGLTKLDKGGLGAIHFAVALGYDWAIEAIIVAA
ncbi:hypothetical protein Patl1_01915 [Pistacia atlantica]|uniref:Uncharacterized protein n=1 Tax=Pistacia atlantica TaxID=434234 RepID=A0ACC1CCZ6_9ROSI|nr:hypothetical protein Patl1_01915 [Pistacia atlantica]